MFIGIGMNMVRSGGGSAFSLLPETVSLIARFTTPATDERKVLINNRISALIDAGIWSKLDCDYVLAAADAQAAQRNWKADAFNLSPVNAPTFTADRGYAGDGASSYLNTSFAPSVAVGQFARDSASFGVWSRTNSASDTFIDIGGRTTAATGQSLMQIRRTTSNATSHRINQDAAGSLNGTVLDSIGEFVTRRSAAGATAIFRNGVSVITGSQASVALSAVVFFIGAVNTGGVAGNFSSREYAIGHIGANLSDAEILAKYQIDLAYLQGVGAA